MFHMPSALQVVKNQTCSYNTCDQTRYKLYMYFVYVARGVENSAKPGGFQWEPSALFKQYYWLPVSAHYKKKCY